MNRLFPLTAAGCALLVACLFSAALHAAPTAAAEASAPAGAASAPAPTGKVWLAGPAGSVLTLPEAIRQAADGDVIELMPGDYTERLVIENRRLTIRGPRGSDMVKIVGSAKPMAERALWTIKGGDMLLQDLEFRGARSAEGSGAALRQQGGKLTLRRCRFFDNEHGLVASNDAKAEVVVEGGVFGRAPRIVGALPHLVTIGRIARFHVSGARFQQGFEGHLLKTRARENLIAYNFIHDGLRGGASLEIDIAQGGIATVIGNVIGQGSESQNPVLLSYGSEEGGWDVNRLHVAHNTFINHGWLPAWFLRVHRGNLPPGTELVAINNLLVGGGVFEWGNEGHFEGNRHARRGQLADVETHAFELPPASSLRATGIDPRRVRGLDLAPRAEFEWSLGRKDLDPPPERRSSWTPGAFQK